MDNLNNTTLMLQNIIFFAGGDVTGDRMPDNVFLTGIRTPDSPFIQNITLVVQNGMTGALTTVPLRNNVGYNPRVFLGDFTGDNTDDILISIDTGGSGATTYQYIYTFANNIPRQIFDSDVYNEEYNYEINYKDNYKVEATSLNNREKYIIDISLRDPQYLNEIYYSNGKLKAPISGFVNPISGFYPVDFDSNGVYEILVYQKIAGRYNADSLGYFLNTLSWNGNRFVLSNQNVAIWGAQY
jgi:hypothetical protein